MAIQCPHCQFPMELKGARPGKYTPRCQRCREKFSLAIGHEPDAVPAVSLLHDPNQQTISPAVAAALGLDAPAHGASRAAHAASATLPPSATVAPSAPRERGRQEAATATVAATIAPPSGRRDHPRNNRADDHTAPAAPPMKPVVDYSASPTMNERLGGYQILHKLGQGGMGTVFLARQLSLDRNVALKVLEPTLAADPQFVARFTREAYAAAQLTHHNVVQIHDIGAEERKHFFSMEFVEGRSLADVVRNEGKVTADVAAGYILQAARGLKHAHDHGMIHRDIKPDNLLLSADGIVKVADLGLVKTPGSDQTKPQASQDKSRDSETAVEDIGRESRHDRQEAGHPSRADVTQARVYMGTPAYMAPEQASDAAHVDARADIYSLGCTFYAMVAGRPPFEGRTAMEVMNKQLHEAIVPPQQLVRGLPQRLNEIIVRMTAKKPNDRYGNLGEVIRDLEDYLRIDSTGPFSPKEEHVRQLEIAAIDFNGSSAAKLRRGLIVAFYLIGAIAMVWAYVAGKLPLGGTILGAMVLATASHFVVSGILGREYVFRRVRQWLFGASLKDMISAAIAATIFIAILFVLGLHWIWLGVLVGSAVLAVLFHVLVDRAVAAQRGGPVGRVQDLLRSMRLRGLEESALRQFVCRYAGRNWEAFFESLFGYEAKIQARARWGVDDRGQARPADRAWRDALVARIDRRMEERRVEAEQRHLQAVEALGLEASGVPMMEARKTARRRAQNLVNKAASLRQSRLRAAATVAPGGDGRGADQELDVRAIAKSLLDADAEAPKDRHHHAGYLSRRYGGPFALMTGQAMRGVLAFVLLGGFFAWQAQNGWPGVVETFRAVRDRPQEEATDRLKGEAPRIVEQPSGAPRAQIEPLRIPWVPDSVSWAVSSINAGLAGAMLLLSLFWRGGLFGAAVLLAATVTVLGPAYASQLQEVSARSGIAHNLPAGKQSLSILIGLGTWAFAMIVLRPKEA